MTTSPALEKARRYRELAIQRITYTHDEHGTAKLSAALHLTQQALAEAAAALTASEAERERLKDVLDSIKQFGSDTLSGRADGGEDDRNWQRGAVIEMTNRANAALDSTP